MRKLLLIISVLCGVSLYVAAESYLPYAPEGRKWVWRAGDSVRIDTVWGNTINSDINITRVMRGYPRGYYDRLRIEDGRIYLVWQGVDVLMLDMSYHKGDVVYVADRDYIMDTINICKVVDEGVKNIRGIDRKVLTLSNYYGTGFAYWIEGIGSTDELYLHYGYAIPSCDFGPYFFELEACYDGDVCIYQKGDLPLTLAGVSDVGVNTSTEAESEYFDLQGRPVKGGQLTPGLYIRRTGSRVEKTLVK